MKKKRRVFQEEAKTRHTAHWDWDYISWEEIERRLKEAGVEEGKRTSPTGKISKKRGVSYGIWIGLGLLAVAMLLLWVMIR
jgi:hypothetical protein